MSATQLAWDNQRKEFVGWVRIASSGADRYSDYPVSISMEAVLEMMRYNAWIDPGRPAPETGTSDLLVGVGRLCDRLDRIATALERANDLSQGVHMRWFPPDYSTMPPTTTT